MSGKIVFFDIDGTLLGSDGKICSSTKDALNRLRSNGVFVAIATGRAPFMFKNIRKELEIETYVSFNGQYVVFENEIIFNRELNPLELKKLIDFSKENGHSLVFQDHEAMRANQKDQSFIKDSLGSIQFSYPKFDPNYYQKRSIFQALLFSEEKEDALYWDKFPGFDFVRWHRFATDVLPHGGSKAFGIREIVKKLATTQDHVYAFGDGLNDVQMLTDVGTGVAMGNAKEEVKRVADFVTDDVDNDGIFKGLKHLGLL